MIENKKTMLGYNNSSNTAPLLSFIITSYTMNRFNDICKLIESIKAQTYPNIEIIFVADQSNELAKEVEEYLNKLKILKCKVLINSGQIGVNICRNLGILASFGEIIAIIDDDVILFSDWAEETVKSYNKDGSIAAITGPAIPLWEDPHKMSWFPRELYFIWGCTVWDWANTREIRNVGGMNCSFRRDALFKAGLYNPEIGPRGGEEKIKWLYPSGEEVDISLRIKAKSYLSKIIYTPSTRVYHKAQSSRFNIKFLVKRCFRFGYTKHYIKKHFSDCLNEPILKLENEHMKYIIFFSTKKMIGDFFRNPTITVKISATLWLGVSFTIIGYLTYFFVPYSDQFQSIIENE